MFARGRGHKGSSDSLQDLNAENDTKMGCGFELGLQSRQCLWGGKQRRQDLSLQCTYPAAESRARHMSAVKLDDCEQSKAIFPRTNDLVVGYIGLAFIVAVRDNGCEGVRIRARI